MKKWLEYLAVFYKNKAYMFLLGLTAFCSYGFLFTHSTVGIDDTPYSYYFEEGLVAIVGRWVLFLVNKVFHIAEYVPFITDFAGVVFFIAAVIIWSALFYSILGEKVPWYGYLFFAGIFLSCPLISEVYTYHLHNGISIGYLCSGISLCFFREGIRSEKAPLWKGIRYFAGSAIFLWISLGCYESFMIVWLLGIFLILLTRQLAGGREKIFLPLVTAGLTAVCAILLRSVMIVFVIKAFSLEYLREDAVQRSITEMAAWMLEPGAKSEFAMVLKRIFVMYGVFAYAYYPIKIFLLAAVVILCFGIWRSIRQRDIRIIFLVVGSFVVSFLLVVVEGKATLYRSAQFFPVFCGYGALLFAYGMNEAAERIRKISGKTGRLSWSRAAMLVRALSVFVLSVILWNQCTDMNHWFYVDYLKYENAKNVVNQIAYELETHYDTSKPIVFTGTYKVPESIIGDAYVKYGSETFYQMNRITSRVDEHLLEKFYRSYGVWVAQTPENSVLDWGRYAFGDDSELVKFFKMHGHEIRPLLDASLYEAAEEYSLNLPSFPAQGSIVDMGEYIVVHF